MDHLRAPWRAKYVASVGDGEEDCFLCAYAQPGNDAERKIVFRWKHWYAVLNAYPYINGHILLVLARHHEGFSGLASDERVELPEVLERSEKAVRQTYEPDGLNMGVNVGRVAGAGAVGHLHIHLVPRWEGDTNFMSTVGETRVLPESLEKSYVRLQSMFAKLSES